MLGSYKLVYPFIESNLCYDMFSSLHLTDSHTLYHTTLELVINMRIKLYMKPEELSVIIEFDQPITQQCNTILLHGDS